MKRLLQAFTALLLLAAPTLVPVAAGASDDEAATYTVTLRNLTSGQYLTPPNFAAHDDDVSVFERGDEASAGVQAVAENGAVGVLGAELAAAIDAQGHGVSGVGGAGPVAPGGEVTWEFTTDADHLSIVSMLVCTNDGFAGLDSRRLPRRDGGTRTYNLRAYDAGTELNTELHVDTVPAPFCDSAGVGTDQTNPALAEDGEIRRHRGIRGDADIDAARDWRGPVAQVTVSRVDVPATYVIDVENLTDGQYLTPVNVAVHDRSVGVFSRGQVASAGVQAVAENGMVGVLGAELQGKIDDAGLGASGVAGGGPIGPGASASAVVTSSGNRLSIVSMLVCTNDGFAGLDSKRFDLDPGESRTFYVRAFDAGTEVNTELHVDTVPAPFCDSAGVGTDQTNPALAEHDVIRRHRGIRGDADIDASRDWNGPVAKVTITRS